MMKLNSDQLEHVYDSVVIEFHEPVLILGQFGAGKTKSIEAWCKKRGHYLCKVVLSQYQTVDLKGTPWVRSFPDNENDEDPYQGTVWHPAMTLPFKGNPNFPTDRKIIIFLDDITNASVAVQQVCYQMTDEKRIGENPFMSNVEIICAGNRASDKGGTVRTLQPLNNRVTQYEYQLDHLVWSRIMNETYGYQKAAFFVAYFNWQPDDLCTWNPAAPEPVVCTPRTAEKGLKYFNSGMRDDIKRASLAGCMGDDVAVKIFEYVKIWSQVGDLMKDITKNPTTAWVPTEMSLKWAVAISISGMLSVKNCSTYFKYLKRMDNEYLIAVWQLAIAREPKLFDVDEFYQIAKMTKDIFGR